MEEESQSKIRSTLFSAILIIAFGWSSVWIGMKAGNLAIETINGSTSLASNISKNTANIFNSLSSFFSAFSKSKDLTASSSPLKFSLIKKENTQKDPSSSLSIIIAGDIMMDRNVRKIGQKYGYDTLFASSTDILSQADITVANLEGPITSYSSKTLFPDGHTSKELIFTFEPSTADALTKAGIDVISLANNHSDNFGPSGLEETKKWLSKANIQSFGDSRNSSTSEAIITKNGITVAFVGYHAFQPGFDRILNNVKRLSEKGYFVIVMPHWGTEYASSSSPTMRSQARALVAAGAKAIFGTHPHVVLEHSSIGDIPVFYSLGNFIFDQYFSPEVMKGNIVEMRLSNNSGTTTIDQIKIFETSTASRRTVTVNPEAMDF